ncbi:MULTISPECIES: AIM24 family protein [unclassified Adlercreutzia]|uniref:AIM24 family protein n=1 Tax=unclassified Adlercreutzia TaxID=2636013 RepID=UPI0013E9CEC3|nr:MULTISPECIES: AIM24 family protein [unclassified Adlercreutzia]
MSYRIQNLFDNDDVEIVEQLGAFSVLQWKRDLSVNRESALSEYFAAKMNVHRRQVVVNMAELAKHQLGCTVQAGAMQWMAGDVRSETGIKGAGDFFGKMVGGAVSGEGAIKPLYTGTGTLMLEPTYKYLLLLDINDWNGSLVLDDGLFLASYSSLKHRIVRRSNLSSAVGGGEGLFNLSLSGQYGVVAIESPVPREELIEIHLDNDQIKIDGNMALAWSSSLEFTVERSGKSLVGSAASGEGLVNVYRGTGKIIMAPTQL